MNNDWKSALGNLLPDDYTPEPEANIVTPEDKQAGVLLIEIDRKRAGKTATIVSGFSLSNDAVSHLAREIKQRLGAGGSARAGEILIQGDRREALSDYLRSKGFKTKVI